MSLTFNSSENISKFRIKKLDYDPFLDKWGFTIEAEIIPETEDGDHSRLFISEITYTTYVDCLAAANTMLANCIAANGSMAEFTFQQGQV